MRTSDDKGGGESECVDFSASLASPPCALATSSLCSVSASRRLARLCGSDSSPSPVPTDLDRRTASRHDQVVRLERQPRGSRARSAHSLLYPCARRPARRLPDRAFPASPTPAPHLHLVPDPTQARHPHQAPPRVVLAPSMARVPRPRRRGRQQRRRRGCRARDAHQLVRRRLSPSAARRLGGRSGTWLNVML